MYLTAACDALAGHLEEEVLHPIEPGRRGGGEVVTTARITASCPETGEALVDDRMYDGPSEF